MSTRSIFFLHRGHLFHVELSRVRQHAPPDQNENDDASDAFPVHLRTPPTKQEHFHGSTHVSVELGGAPHRKDGALSFWLSGACLYSDGFTERPLLTPPPFNIEHFNDCVPIKKQNWRRIRARATAPSIPEANSQSSLPQLFAQANGDSELGG